MVETLQSYLLKLSKSNQSQASIKRSQIKVLHSLEKKHLQE